MVEGAEGAGGEGPTGGIAQFVRESLLLCRQVGVEAVLDNSFSKGRRATNGPTTRWRVYAVFFSDYWVLQGDGVPGQSVLLGCAGVCAKPLTMAMRKNRCRCRCCDFLESTRAHAQK